MVEIRAADIPSPATAADWIWRPYPVAEVCHVPLTVLDRMWSLSCAKSEYLPVGKFCAGVVKSNGGDVPMPSVE